MTDIAITDVVLDDAIYPRAAWSQSTVDRYAEALAADEVFPPIVIESETNRLLDGMHRLRAHRAAGRESIAVDHHEIPAGVPAKLYAASLSARNGDRIIPDDMREIAREIATANPDFSVVIIAKHLGVTRKTVGKWVGDIAERRREVRKAQELILKTIGWPQKDIATQVGVSQQVVSADLQEMGSDSFPVSEDLLSEAASTLPMDCTHAIEEIRQERIFAAWSDDERDLLKRLRDGETIVVSLRSHASLIGWATEAGLYERVDRKSPWGNPFVLPDDGARDEVIAKYAQHYLPYKPSLLKRIESLAGKALGCWCAPEACHADVLKEATEQ